MSILVSTNPAKNYEVLGKVKISTENEIKQKVKLANEAKAYWRSLEVKGRVSQLKRLVEEISLVKGKLALLETKEMGMPISQSRLDIDDSIRYFQWYLDNAEKYLSPEVVYQYDKIFHKIFY